MNKQCNCHAMLGMIETLLDKLSDMPRDTNRLGTPAVVAVENLLNSQHARIQSQHERNCIPHPTQSRMIVTSEERQRLRGLA